MNQIQYETQRLSLRFFMLMLVMFLFQMSFGLLLAAQQADPTLLRGVLNFNVVRAGHLGLGILWVLSGFIGIILFIGPLLAKRELAAPWLIKFLFVVLVAIAIWNSIAQGFAMRGIAGWWMGQPWIQQGLEYLEAGRLVDVLILVGFVILAYVVLKSFPPVRDWNEIHWGLGLGLLGLTLVWMFSLFSINRLDLSEYFRWYVVHYWVEGVWEVIHISLVGFLLVLMFKADVKSVGYAVFWGVSLVWLSGLIGNAHHYFWIGTPAFWQFWGSLFSALEPLPLVFCFWHIYLDAHHDRKPLENSPAFYFILGSVVLEQVGAGILGFTFTFALTNVWSHGTWVTPGHAHLALFGTFGMLGIAGAYYIVPMLRGLQNFDQRLGKLAFWLCLTGMLGMALAFSLGGQIQIFTARTLGLDWYGGDVFRNMGVFKMLLPMFGSVFAIGAGLLVFDLLTMGHRAQRSVPARPQAALAGAYDSHGAPVAARAVTRWSRPLSGYEAGIWLLGMWVFGFIIMFSLLVFNLPSVQAGDPTLPYLLAGIGYPGLLGITLLFIWRFLSSLEARALRPAPAAEETLALGVPALAGS